LLLTAASDRGRVDLAGEEEDGGEGRSHEEFSTKIKDQIQRVQGILVDESAAQTEETAQNQGISDGETTTKLFHTFKKTKRLFLAFIFHIFALKKYF